jgi:hypothetical protein
MIRRVSAQNPLARIIVTVVYAQSRARSHRGAARVNYVVGNSLNRSLVRLALNVLNGEAGLPEVPGRAEIFCSDIFLQNVTATPHLCRLRRKDARGGQSSGRLATRIARFALFLRPRA